MSSSLLVLAIHFTSLDTTCTRLHCLDLLTASHQQLGRHQSSVAFMVSCWYMSKPATWHMSKPILERWIPDCFSWWWTWFRDLLRDSHFQTLRHLSLQISVSVSLFLIPLSLLPQKHCMPLHLISDWTTDFGGWICSTAKAGRPLRHPSWHSG